MNLPPTTPPSVARLGPFREFQARLVRLNGLHNPDEPVHAQLMAVEGPWAARAPVPRDPDNPLARLVQARKDLVAIHNGYPVSDPAWDQAAYLLRAIAGRQPFGAGNVRTAWDYVASHLLHHRVALEAGENEVDELLSWLGDALERSYPDGLPRHLIPERDLVWTDLAAWFRRSLAPVGSRREAKLAIALA